MPSAVYVEMLRDQASRGGSAAMAELRYIQWKANQPIEPVKMIDQLIKEIQDQKGETKE